LNVKPEHGNCKNIRVTTVENICTNMVVNMVVNMGLLGDGQGMVWDGMGWYGTDRIG
jgi:hypothetical protein